MGIKIHHGPDGTFKTSGAIKDDILKVIKRGRVLITNIRGFSRERCIQVLGKRKVHNNFRVIFVDTELQDGRDKLARFFHWAPEKAFFVIDEVQRIFKPAWKEKDLALLKIYEGKPPAQGRPEDIHVAFDMQRHHGWDFVLTTTSIKKVHSLIKDMAKVAIRHVNLGISRFYKTVEHDCANDGKSKSNKEVERSFNWVPSKVFALYSSTKTGSFENAEPRTPVYKNPTVVFLVLFLFVLWSYLFSKGTPKTFQRNNPPSPEASVESEQASPVQSSNQVDKARVQIVTEGVLVDSSPVLSSVKEHTSNGAGIDRTQYHSEIYRDVDDPRSVDNLRLPFAAKAMYVSSVVKIKGFNYRRYEYLFEFLNKNDESFFLSNLELEQLDYKFRFVSQCLVSVIYQEREFVIMCKPRVSVEDEPSQFESNQENSASAPLI